MESMAEEFKKRENLKPDQWTLKWWSSQFAEQAKATRGATHACNLVLGEFADRDERIKLLEDGLKEANVLIGKLLEADEKQRVAYLELKKQVK